MSLYRNVLIAVDLARDTAAIARRGLAIARLLDAEVLLIHVIPPPPIVVPVPPEPIVPDLVITEARLIEVAQERMTQLATELDLPASKTRIVVGDVRGEIIGTARQVEAELIVLGTHESHGRSLLAHFSTEDRVLHGAPCDVLAVRVP